VLQKDLKKVLFHSFYPKIIAELKRVFPEVEIYLLSYFYIDIPFLNSGIFLDLGIPQTLNSLREKRISGISIWKSAVDREDLLNIKKYGLKIFVWTCNSKKEIEYFVESGASGIITDNPLFTSKVLNSI